MTHLKILALDFRIIFAYNKFVIGCIDLDCFYVSCERARDPSLFGKPLVVGGGDGRRGVVLSASYEVRKYGVKSGMPLFKARELFPHFLNLKPDFKYYEEISKKIRNLIFSYTPLLEQGSIDEFYISFKGCERLYKNDFFGTLEKIRREIKEKFKVPSSAGLSSTKCTSKILSKIAKPEKQIYLLPKKEKEFLALLPIEFIPGIGKKTEKKLKELGFKRIRDIQNCKESVFLSILGKEGGEIYKKAMGSYEEPLFLSSFPKSIGNQQTLWEETTDLKRILSVLLWLIEESVFRMRSHSLSSRRIEIKIKYGDFKTESTSHTFSYPTSSYKKIKKKGVEIFLSLYKRRARIRSISFSLSNFEKDFGQLFLSFLRDEKEEKILKTMDFIKNKYGIKLISFGSFP